MRALAYTLWAAALACTLASCARTLEIPDLPCIVRVECPAPSPEPAPTSPAPAAPPMPVP